MLSGPRLLVVPHPTFFCGFSTEVGGGGKKSDGGGGGRSSGGGGAKSVGGGGGTRLSGGGGGGVDCFLLDSNGGGGGDKMAWPLNWLFVWFTIATYSNALVLNARCKFLVLDRQCTEFVSGS